MLKGAIHKDHINRVWAVIDITRMKELINTLEMDIDFGIQNCLILLKNFNSAAPRQKLGITRYISYQAIHSVG
jgi:hypothetical protein